MTATLPPETAPIVVRDVHPATVTMPDGGDLIKARVVLTQQRVYVYVDRNRSPHLEWSAPFERDGLVLPERGASRGKQWRVPTVEGLVVVQPSGGCGCGSSLKAFSPWRPMRRGEL